MGYSETLKAAGAKVIDYEEFGDYQGRWMAYVELNGERCIVEGYYGSCSGCDSFQAEFGWGDSPYERDGKYYKDYDDEITKEEYEAALKSYNDRLAEFGEGYLKNPVTKEIIETRIANLEKDDWFSDEEKDSLQWALNKFNNEQNAQASVATEAK
jgi:hypothetical protein